MNDGEIPAEVLGALGDAYSARILASARTPVSTRELSDRLDIPIATCYRRIEDLVESGLLTHEGRRLTQDGRRTSVYRRTVDEVTIDLTDDRPALSVCERSETGRRTADGVAVDR